jgi:two-component system CheB/CheR fusion protein
VRTADHADGELEDVLELVRRARGFDFTGYKRASLSRRIRRRMEKVGCQELSEYADYLEVHPGEFEQLFDVILINVTEFFRDPAAWACLRDAGVPAMLEDKPPGAPVRVWSAGCATGQEAYTVAMVLAEALGVDAYRERVKIYATDIDEVALATARQGQFAASEMESVPEELLKRYFEPNAGRYAFRRDLRGTLIFGINNLVSDAPISRLDLLVCRNTLMYLNAETQERILRHFQFALCEGGVLMLGRAEMMTSHRDLFAAVDLRQRVFRKLPHVPSLQARVASMAVPKASDGHTDRADRVARDAALVAGPHALIIVSADGVMRFANQPARALFGIGDGSIGRPLVDQAVARQPVDLHDAVERVLREGRAVALGDAAFSPPDVQPSRLAVSAAPLRDGAGVTVGIAITFVDVTQAAALREELDRSRHDLEAAYEELESTIDELETTNEELQSANEELQTTNEELQSTNEELETMNDELQSTNEELVTSNTELRDRTSELDYVNGFLEVILTSLGVAVTVLDHSRRVQVWNRAAEDLWGLREAEALDQDFLALDIGLEPQRLASALRAVIFGGEPRNTTLEAVNRRGRSIRCEVSILPLSDGDGEISAPPRGAIVLMGDERAQGTGATDEAESRAGA